MSNRVRKSRVEAYLNFKAQVRLKQARLFRRRTTAQRYIDNRPSRGWIRLTKKCASERAVRRVGRDGALQTLAHTGVAKRLDCGASAPLWKPHRPMRQGNRWGFK